MRVALSAMRHKTMVAVKEAKHRIDDAVGLRRDLDKYVALSMTAEGRLCTMKKEHGVERTRLQCEILDLKKRLKEAEAAGKVMKKQIDAHTGRHDAQKVDAGKHRRSLSAR